MIAQLQRFLTLGTFTLLVFGLAALWSSGHPAWGAFLFLLVIGGYSAVLGLEFCLLLGARGEDATPKPTPGQLLRAWIGEVTHASLVFAWRQPFRSQLWPDHLPPNAQGQRGVLLVHGFFCNRGLWNRWLQRLTARGVPFVAINLEPPFSGIDDYAPIVDAAVQQLWACTSQAPLVIAHSMGGLAVRRWWADQGDPLRVHRLITIGTPHQGTWLAQMAFSRNGRQMQLNSDWLRDLAQCEAPLRSAQCTCFYGHCDNIVFPPRTAMLAGADNRHLVGVAHVHMVDHPEPWAEALRVLADTSVAHPLPQAP
jgi:triacylglycerol lipase